MNKSDEIFVDLIKDIKKTQQNVFTAIVTEVNENENTVTVKKEHETEIYEVRLSSVIDKLKTKFIIYPKPESYVLCANINGNDRQAVILKYSEITKIAFNTGEVIYNDGNFGGLVKINELKSQLEKMTGRIDKIIEAINSGKPAIGSADGGSALLTTIKTGLLKITSKEDFCNIEDEKIKH